MKDTIIYLKKVPVVKAIFGYAVLFFGAVSLFSSLTLAGICIAVGITVASTEGIQINFKTKRYRTVWSIAGLHLGAWKPCPEFEYVSVFNQKESQRINIVTATTNMEYQIIAVNLFYGNKHLTFFKTHDKEKAFKVAEHFRMIFNLDILDATGEEKKWLYNDTLY